METLFSQTTKKGFRLQEFELLNWGTFHNRIYTLKLDGENALLTGDIGSGKSTIVDALTTLFLPPSKIIYNKAAGAGYRERTLYSYVSGEYRIGEELGILKPLRLRDHTYYTVLVANFHNEGLFEDVSLGLFLYQKPNTKEIVRFYFFAQEPIHIKEYFSSITDIRKLKKALKQRVEVFENYKEYFTTYKRALGIKSSQAMELFYQTVSMKAVGNLTDFIRTHMLEKRNIDRDIDELIVGFSELKSAHDAVVEAKQKIEALEKVEQKAKEKFQLDTEIQNQENLKKDATKYFALHELKILQLKKRNLAHRMQHSEYEINKLKENIEKLQQKERQLQNEYESSGGARLKELDLLVQQHQKELQRQRGLYEKYAKLLQKAGKTAPKNQQDFLHLRQQVANELTTIEHQKEQLQNKIAPDMMSMARYEEECKEIALEVAILGKRKSNIEPKLLQIRQNIAHSIGVEEDELPFAGELLQVENEEFKGAIERVLRGFGLTLLVDEEYYADVSEYIDTTNLKARLVYLRIDPEREYEVFWSEEPKLLYNHLAIKQDSPFYEYIRYRLSKDFDYILCEDARELRRIQKGVTKSGQIKQNQFRHEKDDRFDINEERNYILGWDNEHKLALLQERLQKKEEKIVYLKEKIEKNRAKIQELEAKRDLLRDILQHEEFHEIDYFHTSKSLQELKEEREILQNENDKLKNIAQELNNTKINLKVAQKDLEKLLQQKGEIRVEFSRVQRRVDELLKLTDGFDSKNYEKILHEQFGIMQNFGTIEDINKAKEDVLTVVERSLKQLQEKLKSVEQTIISLMKDYLGLFKLDQQELDATMQSLQDFLNKLQVLRQENLPAYEKEFRRLFEYGTVNHIVKLRSDIEAAQRDIEEKIALINTNLKSIEYNPGTYIEIEYRKSADMDIREFLTQLRNITTNTIDEENRLDEEKFERIKNLIERFRGREGYSDLDKKWRQKISDIRSYYEFVGVERYRANDEVKEYYSDSSGKSGGQKEKLAYTILASALSYQFGLLDTRVKSRIFRFAMIDEAFGKGSDESARYALELFKRLDLQLLIVTPKQKIHVIEPYVKNIHFVFNEEGSSSKLLHLSIEEYQDTQRVTDEIEQD